MSERPPGETVAAALTRSLAERGIGHAFGIPGDYVLGLCAAMEAGPLHLIVTADEQGAGFAADAYARVRGLGAVVVTYGVGGLKVVNTTAQAYAERSPVVVVSGAPGVSEQLGDPLLHHKVRSFATQLNVFRELTCAQALLDDPSRARAEIDRVLDAAREHSRPVYIELPRDVAEAPAGDAPIRVDPAPAADPAALAAAVEEIAAMLDAAERPVVLIGEEVRRFALQDTAREIVERANVPFATTLLGKSAIGEGHPRYMGVYAGAMSEEPVRARVDGADVLLVLGAPLSDTATGIFTAVIEPRRRISVATDATGVRHHAYLGLPIVSVLRELAAPGRLRRHADADHPVPAPVGGWRPEPGRPVTVPRLMTRVGRLLADHPSLAVVSDVGDALFGAMDIHLPHGTHFLSPAYYASLGFAVPGALGSALADPGLRPLVLVGDGAFQMTGVELGSVARAGLDPIVVLLDNAGYGTERPLRDGAFNEIHVWAYERLPEVLGGGRGVVVETEDELDAALEAAVADRSGYTLVRVMIGREDFSPGLRRLAAAMQDRVRPSG
jgi:indolepyruvate decarboxylase